MARKRICRKKQRLYILCVRNQGIVPVNKKAFSLFEEINKSLAFIEPEKNEITE